jgi:hypothetical protein
VAAKRKGFCKHIKTECTFEKLSFARLQNLSGTKWCHKSIFCGFPHQPLFCYYVISALYYNDTVFKSSQFSTNNQKILEINIFVPTPLHLKLRNHIFSAYIKCDAISPKNEIFGDVLQNNEKFRFVVLQNLLNLAAG